MASPTPNKGYTYPAHGGAVNSWDTPLNADFDQIDLNVGGYYPITVSSTIAGVTYGSTGTTASSTASTLTIPSSLAQNLYYPLSGTLTQALDIVFPAAGGFYGVNNQSSGSFAVTAYPSGSSALAITVQQGAATLMYMNATVASELDGNQGRLDPIANNTVLGNVSGSSAVPAALTMGTGITPISTSSVFGAPGFAPPGSHKNLSIKVATNTTVTVAADYVTLTDGTYFLTVPVAATCDLGTNGAVNRLDAGAIAAATWYAIFVISDGNGNVGTLASLSGTAPAMPATYTYKARVAWVRTAPLVAQLMGTWQFGDTVQYVVGLAQSSALPIVVPSVTTGNPTLGTYTSFSISNYVPTTAGVARLNARVYNSDFLLAPNGSYGTISSTNNSPPVAITSASNVSDYIELVLESANVFAALTNNAALVQVVGWRDNI